MLTMTTSRAGLKSRLRSLFQSNIAVLIDRKESARKLNSWSNPSSQYWWE